MGDRFSLSLTTWRILTLYGVCFFTGQWELFVCLLLFSANVTKLNTEQLFLLARRRGFKDLVRVCGHSRAGWSCKTQ